MTCDRYAGSVYLPEVEGGSSDDSTPHILTYDEIYGVGEARNG